jgi:trk system potassium uptake protein TrkH
MGESPQARIRRRIAALSPEGLLVSGFASLIVVGTGLLLLPWSHRGDVGVLDALFTSTSAVCVTGLVVVDTGTAYTTAGQIVILLLIQAGGVGVMSFAAMAFRLLGRRLSLRAEAALGSAMLQREVAGEFGRLLRRVLRFVLLAEAAGAVLLYFGLRPVTGAAHAAYSAVFHAVSAFCNAGFSLYADSLAGLRDRPVVVATVMALIVLGGIGHPVVVDLWETLSAPGRRDGRAPRRLALNSKVALATSGVLVLAGFLLLVILGLGPGAPSRLEGVGDALFQSVTSRTAGFNTVDVGRLPLASLMAIAMLMFVGGSPGSCAGGIKTTTFALWLARLRSLLRGNKQPRILGRHIPGDVTRRASMIIGLAVLWNLAGLLLLLTTEGGTAGVGMHDILFEQVSAFGTVGLSTGLTPRLTAAGKLWIAATMFVGRLGPLTIAVSAFARRTPAIRCPEGRIMIG